MYKFEKPKGKPHRMGWRTGFILIAVALVMILGLFTYFASQEAAIPISMSPAPALFLLVGTFLIISDWAEKFLRIDDELQELPQLLADDWDLLRQGRLNKALLMVAATLAMGAVEIHLLLSYRKWFATWGNFNVIAVAIVVSVVVAVIAFRSDWFQWRVWRTPWWVFAIAVTGFFASAGLGTYYAEPVESGCPLRINIQQDTYDWNQTRASRIYIFNSYSANGTSSGGSSFNPTSLCKGDKCGTVYLVIGLIALVVVAIVGSVFILHFWVLATLVLLTVVACIAVRELLLVEDARKHKW